jgi:hypothetical protein
MRSSTIQPHSAIRDSAVSQLSTLTHPLPRFLLPFSCLLPRQIFHLLRSTFATAIGPFFNQFLGRGGVKRNNRPIRVQAYDRAMPDIRRDRNPPAFQRYLRVADQNIRLPLSWLSGLEIAAPFERHHALMTIRMAFRAGIRARTQDKNPCRPDPGW